MRLPSDDQELVAQYHSIYTELAYHANHEWSVYLPAEHPDFSKSYMERLAMWIGNVADENDQKLMLKYARLISFLSHADFLALYRSAMDREITRWISMELASSLDGSSGQQYDYQVRSQILHHTWYCPVTDSLDINEFYKVNNLISPGDRPSFRPLYKLAKAGNTQLGGNLRTYMDTHQLPLQRLVLLEDIVGSGDQSIDTVKWAVTNIGKPILFIPLILCPSGATALRELEADHKGMLTIRPIIEMTTADIIGPHRSPGSGWVIAEDLENFVFEQKSKIPKLSPYGHRETGCSVVTYSNTPDNTLPIVHNRPLKGTWSPLFPRIDRD